MKSYILIISICSFIVLMHSQTKMIVSKKDGSADTIALTQIKNVTFSNTSRHALFSTANIKASDVYFSFALGDSVTKEGDWDIEFSFDYLPDDTAKQFKYPAVKLNRQRDVYASIVDGVLFGDVDPFAVNSLSADTEMSYVIGVKCLSYDPLSHKLLPYNNRTFIFSISGGKRVKMRINSYYNDANQSGVFTFEYLVK